ncbi:hypothetical protein [Methylophaga sp.]|uniref:hypothetical protein n=1 Tax=Methylophaga sp. TaxID=2024840 RepID=UPI0027272143|nr:hypothetical protein [Methylophaga sp.]MDO8826199.1 hypothetical protein [Methylophaga sp.]
MKNWIIKEMPLLKAWVILFAINVLLSLSEPNFEIKSNLITQYLITTLFFLFLLICIRYIRGKYIQSRKFPSYQIEMGVWGYIWRFLVTIWVTSIFVLLGIYLITGQVLQNNPLLGQIIFVIASPFVVWLLFCKERIAFVKKVLFYLRGIPI